MSKPVVKKNALEVAWRMLQLWDWGHNCKVLGFSFEKTDAVFAGYQSAYTATECDRFWEGYNAPRSRSLLVPIYI